jgi:hypothetical protein
MGRINNNNMVLIDGERVAEVTFRGVVTLDCDKRIKVHKGPSIGYQMKGCGIGIIGQLSR